MNWVLDGKAAFEVGIGNFGKYHNTLLFPRKFCINIVFVFSWDHCKSQEKVETMLMQNVGGGGGGKQRILWYFPKWPITDM